MTFGSDLYEAVHPLAASDEQEGYALRLYTEAVGAPYEWVCTYALDSDLGPGWSLLLDPAQCPAEGLPWLGQFVGVVVNPSYTEAQQRAQVAAHYGFRRGTPAAVVLATQLTLAGTHLVYLNERLGGDAYAVGVATLVSETPDAAATQRAVQAALPAGLVLTYSTTTGQPYATAGQGKTYANWKATYPDYAHLRTG